MFAFLIMLVLVGGLVLVAGAFNLGRVALDNNRRKAVESVKALNTAERTLRSIANGAGNPVLEAQIALDEINIYHEREINP